MVALPMLIAPVSSSSSIIHRCAASAGFDARGGRRAILGELPKKLKRRLPVLMRGKGMRRSLNTNWARLATNDKVIVSGYVMKVAMRPRYG